MADTFEFTLDEESEKKLFDILTDVNVEKTPAYTITDKDGHTAEYKKVLHGKWIKNDNGTYTCSRCNSWIPQEQQYYAKYCLYCGAKMVNHEETHDCI